MCNRWPLELPLLTLSNGQVLTLQQALLSVLIIGGKGSGKTSGSMRAFRRAFLKTGFGFLVLCCKADAAAEVEALARECGRGDDLRHFRVDNGSAFNAIDYASKIHGPRSGMVEALAAQFQMLQQSISIGLTQSSEDVWNLAFRQLLKKAFFTQMQAVDRIDLADTLRVVQTLPSGFASLEKPEQLHSLRLLMEAETNAPEYRQRELGLAQDYFLTEMPGMSSRTQSSLKFTASGFLDTCLSYPIYDLLFGSQSNLTPDDVLAGRIVLIDVSVEAYPAPVGQLVALAWKTATQAAIKQRVATFKGPRDELRPICIDMDEAQAFLSVDDAAWLASSRSARGLMLMATQSLPSIYGTVGADGKAKAKVQEILANALVRVGHRSLCEETNRWFSASLGEIIKRTRSGGTSSGTNISAGSSTTTGGTHPSSSTSLNFGANQGTSSGWSETLQLDLPPRLLVEQKTGGKKNQGEVSGIVIVGGEPFSNGKRWAECSFRQEGWERSEGESYEELPLFVRLLPIAGLLFLVVIAAVAALVFFLSHS